MAMTMDLTNLTIITVPASDAIHVPNSTMSAKNQRTLAMVKDPTSLATAVMPANEVIDVRLTDM